MAELNNSRQKSKLFVSSQYQKFLLSKLSQRKANGDSSCARQKGLLNRKLINVKRAKDDDGIKKNIQREEENKKSLTLVVDDTRHTQPNELKKKNWEKIDCSRWFNLF